MAKETIFHTVIDNGLQIQLKQQPYQRTVNIGLFINHGSQNEDMDSNGISHYIEHVLFNANHMPNEVQELLSTLLDEGLSYNAYTGKEYTRFMIACRPSQTEQALKLLSMIISSKHTTMESIEHERQIILHEHEMAFSSSSILGDLLENAIWGDHSLGLFVIGRKENIRRFDKTEIDARLHDNYIAERTTVVGLGPLDPLTFSDSVERYFEGWTHAPCNIVDPPVSVEPRVVALRTSSPRTDLLIAYPGVPFFSADRYAMELLADILGGGRKSRLFVELREKQKLVYLVSAYSMAYRFGGYLAIKLNCETTALPTVYSTIREELERLGSTGIDEVELARVKATRITALLRVLENSDQHLQLLGRRAVLNDDFFVDIETRRIEAVRSADIVRLAREIFLPQNVAIVGLGPKQEELMRLI